MLSIHITPLFVLFCGANPAADESLGWPKNMSYGSGSHPMQYNMQEALLESFGQHERFRPNKN